MAYEFPNFLDEIEARTRITDAPHRNNRGIDRGNHAYCREDFSLRDIPDPGPAVAQITSHCRYADIFERRDGRWGIIERVTIFGDMDQRPRAFRQRRGKRSPNAAGAPRCQHI